MDGLKRVAFHRRGKAIKLVQIADLVQGMRTRQAQLFWCPPASVGVVHQGLQDVFDHAAVLPIAQPRIGGADVEFEVAQLSPQCGLFTGERCQFAAARFGVGRGFAAAFLQKFRFFNL